MFTKKILIILLSLVLFIGCQTAKDPITGKPKRIEPNVTKRTEAARDSGPGLLSRVTGSDKSTNFEFATSNILWRATLKSLESIPLQSVSYSGGVILTDWYGEKNESIKIEVRFLSSDLSIASLDIKSFKKVCTSEQCSTTKIASKFNDEIKNKIMNNARLINIEDQKTKKK